MFFTKNIENQYVSVENTADQIVERKEYTDDDRNTVTEKRLAGFALRRG